MNRNSMNEIIDGSIAEINILDLIRLLISKLWLILISMALCGAIAFVTSTFTITPTYTATAMLYVNNSAAKVGDVPITISSGQISAAKSLLNTYVVILKTRTTLEAAIEKANLEGEYTYQQLKSIISASSVDNTDIFKISATCADRDDALLIVDTLVEILPDRIADVVDGSSVRLVDRAVRPAAPSSPPNARYGILGLLIGAVVSCGLIIIQDLLNNTVRDVEYLKHRFNLPILAVIPEAYMPLDGKQNSGYKSKNKYKYRYKRRYYKRDYIKYRMEAYQKMQVQDGGDE